MALNHPLLFLAACSVSAGFYFGEPHGALPELAHDRVDFERDIEPILEERCVQCHREKKHKAGLRLDSKSAAMAGSYFGTEPVIVPGDAQESVLFQRVSHPDEDERMPPRGDALDAAQIELLRRWIMEGAHWPDDEAETTIEKHWAYEKPTRPELPSPALADWARNEVDLFILDRLEREGLAPSPEADRATLLRRLSLDLIGLPPTPEQISSFLADERPDAYERLVEELLASPHFGERQARAWLDLARYADTNGFEKDSRRTMWRYRDWVIDAFNADMGFDQFTIEQLAGDLLPDATLDQKIATGFHRNTMINAEGGVDPEEYRVAAVIDRVNTTASVWLGSTMACAQCHTHKYDPFSHRDYYRLFAYFNSTTDIGPGEQPKIDAPNAELAEAERLAVAEIAALDTRLGTWTPELARELEAFEASQAGQASSWTLAKPTRFESKDGTTLALLNDGTLLAIDGGADKDTYTLTFDTPATSVRRLRIDVLTHETLPNLGPGRLDHGNFVLNEVTLQAVDSAGQSRAIQLDSARADFHQTGTPEWPAAATIDKNAGTGWAIAGGTGLPHQLVIELAEELAVEARTQLRMSLEQNYGSMHLIGRLRVSFSPEASADTPLVRPDLEELLGKSDERSAEEQQALEDWFLASAPSLAVARERRSQLEKRERPPTALVMRELDTPRTTHVLERGAFLAPGEVVEPGTPPALHPLPEDSRPDRLGLAQWLVSPENPLTARVTINRLWQQVFARGLVATSEDFGSQGEAPSHPELLDWLALQLQEDDWSIKTTLRRLVLSSSYRQSSKTNGELLRRDPQNRWLARAPRYRVEAEMVRDIALVASGLFSDDIGGPSVFPPQPDGIWASTYSADRWATSPDRDRFRRGLYTFWKRTSPYPTFMAFDAPSRELACIRRSGSNTPLQALALLNDPAFIEAAVALAGRVLREAGSDETRLELAFLSCTGRAPHAEEVQVLSELLATERAHFREHPDAATELTKSEVELGTTECDPMELAAWTVVANVLLNLDETITRS